MAEESDVGAETGVGDKHILQRSMGNKQSLCSLVFKISLRC